MNLDLLKQLYQIESYSGKEDDIFAYVCAFLDTIGVKYEVLNKNIINLNESDDYPILSAHLDMVLPFSHDLPTVTPEKINTKNKTGGNWIEKINEAGFKYFEKTKNNIINIPTFKKEIKDKSNTITNFVINDLNEIRGFNSAGIQCSLGADDKNGVFIILSLLEQGYKFNFILSHGEEYGCVGIKEVIKTEKYKQTILKKPFAIVLDRKNGGDIIGYNQDFCVALDDKLETFSKENNFDFNCANGSLSDTKYISKFIEGVNLSVGYYEPHSSKEFTKLTELNNTMNFVIKILSDFKYKTVSYKRMKKINPEAPEYSTGAYSTGAYSTGAYSTGAYLYGSTNLNKQNNYIINTDTDDDYWEMYDRQQSNTLNYNHYKDDETEEDLYFEQQIEESGAYTSKDIYAICICPICNTDLLADNIPHSKTYAFYCNVCDDYVKTEDVENHINKNFY